jgi:3-hydroxyphenylacetate 6-hydroxylase
MAIAFLITLLEHQAKHQPLFLFSFVTCCVTIIGLVINEIVRNVARIPGLAGPPGLPLIGNLWQIRVNAAEQYRSWSKRYGGVFQIQLGNIPIVVVNSAASAKVIFGQNSQALSSRPEFYTFHKVSVQAVSAHFRSCNSATY